MARPTKFSNFKRFSLRVPAELLKAVKHACVDEDLSVNDWILRAMRMQIERQQQQPLQPAQRPEAAHATTRAVG